tara:strand:- start:8715 stop:9107 length:393 start_codon:yes stop_codon:yes gene_type:complete
MPTYRFYKIKNIESANVSIDVASKEETHIPTGSRRTEFTRLIWLSNKYPGILFYHNIYHDKKYNNYEFNYYCRKNDLTEDQIRNFDTDLDRIALGEELGRTDFGGEKTMDEIVKELNLPTTEAPGALMKF